MTKRFSQRYSARNAPVPDLKKSLRGGAHRHSESSQTSQTGCTRSVNDTPPKADTRRLDTFVHAIQEVSTCPLAAQDRTVTGCNSHHAQGAQGSAQRPPWPASGQHRPYGCLAGPLAGRSPRAARSASTRAFARWRPVVHRAEANPPDRCHLRADSEW